MFRAIKRKLTKPTTMTYEKQTLINQVYNLNYEAKCNLISYEHLNIEDAFSRIVINEKTYFCSKD